MQTEREYIIKKIAAILCVIMAISLAILFIGYSNREKQQNKKIEHIREAARPYEKEIRQIRNEMEEFEKNIVVGNERGLVLVGFQLKSADDYAFVDDVASEYEITPVIVIDLCNENRDELSKQAIRDYKMMMYTVSSMEESIVSDLGKYQKEYGVTYFLLRNTEDNEDNIEIIHSSGYTGCARFSNTADNGVLENGLACTNYSQIKNSNFSIKNRITELEEGKQSLLFVFDLTSDNLTQDAILYDMDQLKGYLDNGSLTYSSLNEVDTAIRANAKIQAVNQEEYDVYARHQRERIRELQDIIDEMYSHWKEDRQ